MTFTAEFLRQLYNSGGMVFAALLLVSLVMWTLILQRLVFLGFFFDGNAIRKNMAGEFSHRRTGNLSLDRKIADELVQTALLPLEKGLCAIGVLAAIAPLLGLLGTVLGMINAFDVITVYGTGNARAMSAGISKALVTTQAGLLAAIPGLYMQGVLSRMAERRSQQVESAGMELKGGLRGFEYGRDMEQVCQC
ncbi:biopolymer transport protein ExbB [Desulfatibacillum alkenivorans DSM 16219]|jgi:biopolymer transport protein ExbB|uniref:Biopolymer transport protein ExbB n=1 Tax=Desulfatibacillum alkenivorans DSM 16219 TaxID=1121393 RepID=A0A1M6NA83_9BACT|nr:MotA/TolQ/ExbB proton channel family protein [Desulfatibacillum alkenivorans]SHJ92628.1 biopolymer transport protein ExbB [Desulfatibacillum alkenivorans DSM 16219]